MKTRVILILAAAAVLGGGFAYLFLFTNTFRFSEISISGITALTREDLFGNAPPYIFQKISVQNPLVASFIISRDLFQKTLSINIIERESYAIWCAIMASSTASDECFWIDASGLLFAMAPESEGALIKSIYDYSGTKLITGDYAASVDTLNKIFEIFQIIDKAGIEIVRYSLRPPSSEEFHALSRDGAEIYFNLRLNQDFAREPLIALMGELKNLQYIDLRSENRVFYK